MASAAQNTLALKLEFERHILSKNAAKLAFS